MGDETVWDADWEKDIDEDEGVVVPTTPPPMDVVEHTVAIDWELEESVLVAVLTVSPAVEL